VLLANALMAALLVWFAGSLDTWLGFAPLERALRLGGCIVLAATLYFGALFLAGLRIRHLRTGGGA
jgi:putative peptidoglycan lipid II flippase